MYKRLGLIGTSVLAASAQAAVVVDDFDTGNLLNINTNDSYNTSNPSVPNTAGPLRYLGNDVIANPNNVFLQSEVSGGALFIEAGPGLRGEMVHIVAGGLTSGTPSSGSGNLSAGQFLPMSPAFNLSGESAFTFHVLSNDLASTQIRVYAWSGNMGLFNSSTYVNLPVGTNYNFTIPFSSIFTTVNPNNIGALGFAFNIPDGNDVAIDMVGAVPEPFSMIAMGLGVAAMATRKRRRN